MALLIVFKSLIGRKAAEGCRVWLQGLAWVWPGFGLGLARVWPGFGCRDWFQGLAAELQGCRVARLQGCRVAGLQDSRAAEDIDR